ncbi:tape measure protein [Gordonia phage LilyPad]|nr:tape measure protein [Gordonia phage LilyPad]
MTDFDLGRAHGEIEITSDVDDEGVRRRLNRIRDSVSRMADKFRDAENKMDRFERAASRMAKTAAGVAAAAGKMASALGNATAQAAKTTAQIAGLSSALDKARSGAESAAKGFISVAMAISELSSVSGLASAALHKLGGVGKELENFPKWAQGIVKVAGALSLVKGVAGSSFAKGITGRMVPAIRSATMAMGGLSIAGVALKDRLRTIASAAENAHPRIRQLSAELREAGKQGKNWVRGSDRIIKGMSQMVIGAAAVRSGIRGLTDAAKKLAPAMKFVAIGVAALGTLGPIGTVLLGLVDAIKQLSGAALILPGALAILGAAGGTLALAISGLGQAFKAGFGDAKDFEKEIEGLSPKLVEFARSIQPLKKEFEDLRNSVTEVAFDGLIDNFKPLADRWLPLAEEGLSEVARGINDVTNELIGFGSSKDTMVSFALLFANTRKVLGNVASGTQPVLRALRTIGMIGTQSIVTLTQNFGGLATAFEMWTHKVAGDGTMQRWVNEGIQGFRDMWAIIRDTSAAVGDLFQAFGGNGEGALEKTAEGAKKLREYMEGLGQNDTFQKVMNHVAYTSDHLLSTIMQVAKQIGETLVSIIPEMEKFSSAFGHQLVLGIKIATETLGVFINILGALGLDTFTGQVVGMAIALKMITPVVMLIVNALKLLAAKMVFTGAANMFLGIATALDTFANKADRANTRVGKMAQGLSDKFLGLAGMMTGPVLAAIAAVVGAFMAIRAHGNYVRDMAAQTAEAAAESREAAQGIKDAFFENNGAFGKNVFDAVGASIDTMQAKIDKVADNGPGFMEWAGASLKDVPTAFGAGDEYNENTKQLQDMDHLQDRALRVREAIDEIGWSQQELTQAVVGTDLEYGKLVAALEGTEYGGGEAIEEFAAQRAEFEAIADSVERLGPGVIQLSNAMGVLADESSTTADRLDAMRSALEAMGLLQVDEAEAFLRLRESIKGVNEELSSVGEINAGQIFNKDGSVDTASVAYGRLWEVLKPASESLRGVAAGGHDVGRAWAEMQPELEKVRNELGLQPDKWQQILNMTGLVPETLTTLYSVNGEAALAELAQLNALVHQVDGQGAEVTTTITSNDTIAQLQSIGAEVTVLNEKTGEVKVKFKDEGVWDDYLKLIARIEYDSGVKVGVELDPEDAKAVEDHIKWLNEQGRVKNTENPGAVEQGQAPAPATPSSTPRQERVPANAGSGSGQKPKSADTTGMPSFKNPDEKKDEKPGQPAPAPAPVAAPPATPEQLPEKKQIDVIIGGGDHLGILGRIKAAVEGLPARKDVQVIIAGGDHLGILARLKAAVEGLPARKDVAVIIAGGDHIGILQRIVAAVQALPARKDIEIIIAGGDHLGIIQAIVDALGRLGQAAEQCATVVVQAFQRMRDAANQFKGSVDGVRTSMDTVANSAFARGARLGQGFADGIKSKQAQVQQASMELARAASAPLPASPAKIGPFSGRGWTPFRGRALAEGFARGIHDGSDETQKASLDMVAKIASAMDQIRVAFGLTPTFFEQNREVGPGGKKYYRDPEVTDAELAEKRAERAERQAEKDEIAAEKAATKIPDAEKRIAEAQEGIVEAEKRAREARTKANEKPGDKKAQDSAFKAEESLDKARERLTKAEQNLQELKDTASYAGTGGSAGAVEGSSDALVKSLDNAQYQMGGFSQAVLDCTGFVSALANARTGRPMFSERGNTTNLREFLKARGFREGKGGEGDLSVGWWDNGGGANGHAAITTESGLNAESTTGGVRFGPGSAGARSNNSQFTDFMYLPGKGGGVAAVPLANKPAIDPTSDQLTQDQVAQLIIARGEAMGATEDEIKGALATALVENGLTNKKGGPDGSTGSFQQRPLPEWTKGGTRNRESVDDAATTFYEKLIATRGQGDIGNRTADVQRPREDLRGKYADRMAEASMFYTRNKGAAEQFGSASGMSATAGNTEDTVALLRANNQKLDQAIRTAEDPNSSEGEVIRALQDIDDAMVGMSATERQSMDSIRDAVMSDRGIKEYDPFEGAPETPQEWFDTIFKGIIQNVVGLIGTIENGIGAAVDMAHLITRGFANTNDVHSFVDGIQGLVGTVTEIASTIGSVIQSVASIAAVAGAAIPGIGQVGAVISTVTGGIGDINAVVDLVQDVAKIGGRLFGGALSSLLGLGGTGQLQGQIRTLMDLNDKTIKTWSDRNAADKSVMGLPGSQARDPNQTSNFRDLNIYQGPGQDPAEMMNNAMFAVAAHSQGVYGG